ncbi:putative periplasmic serine endoprotease DegP-like precursor [Phycisphaerae bacterium RAS1]|nr:putative periplasmic serine endoprotease DegP-like precursor [Phycisphaerae bacterium RAS1]
MTRRSPVQRPLVLLFLAGILGSGASGFAQDRAPRDAADALTLLSRSFGRASQSAKDSVVHIRVAGMKVDEARLRRDVRAREELRQKLLELRGFLGDNANENANENAGGEEQLTEEDVEELVDMLQRLASQMPPASGSGIIFDSAGFILTNHHVVDNRAEIRVVLPDKRELEATLVGSDAKTDLAVIRIEASGLKPLPFADSSKVEVGDFVLAVGSPFGLTHSVTHGIVSAVGRSRVPGIDIDYQDFIQTDAAINPGNSGGPLLNLRGEVVGVNCAIATSSGYNAGVAFTIPSNRAQNIARQLRQSGAVARGWMGIAMDELDDADRGVFEVPSGRGVLVRSVFENSPADKAGLDVEDVMIAVNGTQVASVDQIRGLIAEISPGETVKIEVVRDRQRRDVSLLLDRQPDDIRTFDRVNASRSTRGIPRLGLQVRTLRPGTPAFDVNERGVLVLAARDVEDFENYPLVVGCNGKPVGTVGELQKALEPVKAGEKVRLQVLNPRGDRKLVELTAAAD